MARLTEDELMVLRRLIEEEPSHGFSDVQYPGLRDRESYRRGMVTQRYLRYEATPGYISLATAAAEVIEFSGCPDSIEIFVLDFAAIISFVNLRGEVNEGIQIEAANFYEPGIVYKTVVARNAVAGSVARIQIVGKWIDR